MNTDAMKQPFHGSKVGGTEIQVFPAQVQKLLLPAADAASGRCKLGAAPCGGV